MMCQRTLGCLLLVSEGEEWPYHRAVHAHQHILANVCFLEGHPHASIMYQVSEQNSYPYEVNFMCGFVNFQIKVPILAFYADVCTAP